MRKQIAAVTGATLTTMALSGFALWSRWRTEDWLPSLVTRFLVYFVVSHLALTLIDRIQATSARRLFLAGGILGLLLDGVFAEGILFGFPMTISITALTWHAVVTVVIGWKLLPERLADRSRDPSLVLAGAGALWGLWAINWWGYDGVRSSIAEFATISTAAMTLLAAGLWLRQRGRGRTVLRRWPVAVSAAIVAAHFWFFSLGISPIGIITLPLLLGMALWALLRSRDPHPAPAPVDPPLIPSRRLAVLAIPAAAAVVTYSALTMLPVNPDTSIVLYWLGAPIGYLTLARAAVKPRTHAGENKPDRHVVR